MRDLPARRGRAVRVCGWAEALPDVEDASGAGLILRDHTGRVTLVDPDLALGEQRSPILAESAIEARGTVVDGPEGRGGTVEVALEELRVLGPAEGPPPIDERAPLDARLDWRYLDLRHPHNRLVFEVQTTAERAMREWWAARGFLELHSPKLRSMPNQSGRELFSVRYFDRTAYLAQSPQFYKQMAMCAGLDRVFEVGPVFRANPLHTSRHDTEFTSVDVEVSWIESHEDVMAIEEEWLREVVVAVDREHGREVKRLFGRAITVPDTPFPRLTLADAHRIVAAKGHRSTAADGDLDAEGERLVGEHIAAQHGHQLVFVTEYPEAVRPFYHMRLSEGSDLTRSFDLLWNGLEVTTGAQREHRYGRLVAQAARNPARVEVIRPYLDFFRFGCPPHGGFGLGLTRMLMCLLGVDDVREVTFLYRGRDRLSP